MTTPTPDTDRTDPQGDGLREFRKSLIFACNDPGHFVGYKGERSLGEWQADALIAGPLAQLRSDLRAAEAERDLLRTRVGEMERLGRDPKGSEPLPTAEPKVSAASAAAVSRADPDTPDWPETGWYTDWHGRHCYVTVTRHTQPGREGSVHVDYGDSWTSAFFSTFRRWGYRRANDERALRENAERSSPKDASVIGLQAEAPDPHPHPQGSNHAER